MKSQKKFIYQKDSGIIIFDKYLRKKILYHGIWHQTLIQTLLRIDCQSKP